MNEQLALLDAGAESGSYQCFFENIKKHGIPFEEVDIGDITFKAGQAERIHRWFRLTPSYSPQLVRFFLERLEINRDNVVLDPFLGRGTTAIECQLRGVPCIGIELNPVLMEAARRSLNWSGGDKHLFRQFLQLAQEQITKFAGLTAEEAANRLGTRIPIIFDVFRWWRQEVLRDLIVLRQLMGRSEFETIRDYLYVVLAESSLTCANIHRNHPTITFDDNHGRTIVPFLEVERRLCTVEDDLRHLSADQRSFSGLAEVHKGDSVNGIHQVLRTPVDFVITSPPYPNRYSYVHQTRPQLHFLELLENTAEATEIDLKAIGGTWGRATSNLQREVIEPSTVLRPLLTYFDELAAKSTLMCNYATKYFQDLDKHIAALRPFLAANAAGAYIVGNSRLSGVEIFTETILAKLLERHNLQIERIISFRKRGGRKRLYECAVCFRC